MSRFRSTKRSKELSRKARHQAKEARKRERREKALSGEVDDDIDWSQAVGFATPGEKPEDSVDQEAAGDDSEDVAGGEWRQAVSASLPDGSPDESDEPDPDPER